MEKKPGYKECPRCGLRNKPQAVQCDFCGWNFEESGDDWIEHIRTLEEIGTERPSVVVDEEISKRIQATMVKPEGPEEMEEKTEGTTDRQTELADLMQGPEYVPRIPAPPEQVPAEVVLSAEKAEGPREGIGGEPEPTIPFEREVPRVEETPQPPEEPFEAEPIAAAKAESGGVEEFVESMIEEAEAIREIPPPEPKAAEEPLEVPSIPKEEPKAEAPPERKEKPSTRIRFPAFSLQRAMMPMGILVVGASAYVSILLISTLYTVSWALSWGVSIAGAIMITVGCSQLWDVWKAPGKPESRLPALVGLPKVQESEAEVFICPLCNEVVSEKDEYCPACGAAFEEVAE